MNTIWPYCCENPRGVIPFLSALRENAQRIVLQISFLNDARPKLDAPIYIYDDQQFMEPLSIDRSPDGPRFIINTVRADALRMPPG